MANERSDPVFGFGASFQEHQRFLNFARDMVRLPGAGEAPLAHLLPEAAWIKMLNRVPDPEDWLAALSAATGVYFFPSREFVWRLLRYLRLLKITRLLEAGAGRGYLSAGLAPMCAAAGIDFLAIDAGVGEFVSELPVYQGVARGDVFRLVQDFQPQVVLYGWPPPGQSLAAICREPFLHYLMVIGVTGGGVTGAREDWEVLPQQFSAALSRYGRGRGGIRDHGVTIFYGAARSRPSPGPKVTSCQNWERTANCHRPEVKF